MSQKRRSRRILVRSLGLGLPAGARTGVHAHHWGQLVYATSGVLHVTTPAGLWVLPPARAAWIPPGAEHDVEAVDACRMQTLYFRPDVVGALPRACCVMSVAPLLLELILEVRRVGMLAEKDPAQARLADVIVDRLATTREAALDLRMPADARARRVAERIRRSPAAETPLPDLVRGCGASLRTIERSFVRDTGHTLGRWRQRARLLEALRLLATGESVTRAALIVGYDSPSAFIAMFKRVLGTTPRRWVAEGAYGEPH